MKIEYCSTKRQWIRATKHKKCSYCFNHHNKPQHPIPIVPVTFITLRNWIFKEIQNAK